MSADDVIANLEAAKQKALHAKVMAIDALTTRIDVAIQQARAVGDAASAAAAAEDPAPS